MGKDRPGGMDDRVPTNPSAKVPDKTSMSAVKSVAGGKVDGGK